MEVSNWATGPLNVCLGQAIGVTMKGIFPCEWTLLKEHYIRASDVCEYISASYHELYVRRPLTMTMIDEEVSNS